MSLIVSKKEANQCQHLEKGGYFEQLRPLWSELHEIKQRISCKENTE